MPLKEELVTAINVVVTEHIGKEKYQKKINEFAEELSKKILAYQKKKTVLGENTNWK